MSVTTVDSLADRHFVATRNLENVDEELCHLLWGIFGPGGWENYTTDHYDRSIEVFGVKPDVRLTDDALRHLWDAGFERCWTHVALERVDNELGEIYYMEKSP